MSQYIGSSPQQRSGSTVVSDDEFIGSIAAYRKARRLSQRRHRRGELAVRGLATIVVMSSAATVIGIGAYATFTDTQSATPTIGSGTITLAPIGTTAVNNRLSVGATNIAAGDTIQRSVNIKNTGTITLSTVTLTTSASPSSLLDTDATNGLQVLIEKCSVAWVETGGPPYTYTCGGTTTTVRASSAIIGTNLALSNISLGANVDNFARVTITLPTAAGNTFQGLSSTINFAFTATQRAGASQ